MNLEVALQENTAALNAHREALLASIGKPGLHGHTPDKKAATEPAKTVVAAQVAAQVAQPVAAAAGAVAVAYADVSKAITALANAKGREAAVGVIGSFQNKDDATKPAANGAQIAPADYAAVLEACAKASTAETTLV